MSRSLQDIAQQTLDTIIKKGASQAAVSAGRTQYSKLAFRQRKLESIESSETSGVTVTVYLNGHYSSNSTNDLREASLDSFCEQALAMTKVLTPDQHRALPEPEYYQGRVEKDLGLFDPQRAKVSVEERKQFAQAIEEAALGHSDKVISATATYYDSQSHSVRLHSNGFSGSRRTTIYSAGAGASVQGEGDRKPSDSWYIKCRNRADLADPARIGRKAVQRALDAIGGQKLPSARMPLVVENRAMLRLIGHLTRPLSASTVQQKRSCYADKLGQKIASQKLTLTDDPLLQRGLGSRLYDGEGLTAKAIPIFDQGVLKNFYIDVYYGRKMGSRANTGSSSNLIFSGGQGSLEDLIKGVERGILVRTFIGGNSSEATGDFSLGIRGHLINKGKLEHPVTEMNITDNLLTFLPKLTQVAADPYPYSSVQTPSVRFDDIQFSGV